MPNPLLYTVGHSKHPIDYFIGLLQAHGVTCVVDVRSLAASRFNPQFNKERLAAALKQQGIAYLHFAREFGARQTDMAVLDTNGQVDFEKVRQTDAFRQGVKRLIDGATKGYVIALMCAEADPLECHRFSMVAVALKEQFNILHILKDKTLVTNEALEVQLRRRYRPKVPGLDMYAGPADDKEKLAIAYKLVNKAIGYKAGDDQ